MEGAAALFGSAVPNVVDDKTTHGPSGVGDEVGAIRKAGRIAFTKAKERLVEQGRSTQRSAPVASKLEPGKAVQLFVKRREQILGAGRSWLLTVRHRWLQRIHDGILDIAARLPVAPLDRRPAL
jgi:hypothetical protein